MNIDQPIALGILALFLRSTFDVLLDIGPGLFRFPGGPGVLPARWSLVPGILLPGAQLRPGVEAFLPLVVLRRKGEGEEPVGVADRPLVIGSWCVTRSWSRWMPSCVRAKATSTTASSPVNRCPCTRRRGHREGRWPPAQGGDRTGSAAGWFNDSHLKRLWEEHAGSLTGARPSMPRLIDTVARRFTVGVLLVALGAGLYWWGRDAAQVWPVVTAVLIVACPRALALSMPFAYGHTMRLLGRRGLFLRDAEVVERLAHVDTVVFDKTGTLTARESYDLAFEGRPLDAREVMQVRSLARNSAHPLSAEVYRSLQGDLWPGEQGGGGAARASLGTWKECRCGWARPRSVGHPPRIRARVATVDVAIGGLHREGSP